MFNSPETVTVPETGTAPLTTGTTGNSAALAEAAGAVACECDRFHIYD